MHNSIFKLMGEIMEEHRYDSLFGLIRKYRGVTSQLETKLNSNDRSPKNLMTVNNLQRSLFDLAVHAYTMPDFFTDQTVDKICNMLEQAGKYLQGTVYEARALERPNEFRDGVEAMKKAAEARKREIELYKVA